ncbi:MULTISPECIES: LPS export ABC transporter permease LptF [unclassified Methylophaga]|mgnify:FL=1|jgi:lipopolysaccharide export system permease protein|uniref:LPS export ABC transporter permease LptF n=1 Tax=unclassified Methylophaga TaxID=2629249 RepID=UPI0023B5FFE5|nr:MULTISPECIES: LPS export ABC transporter permease LptF [unclassified Methylophaga]|tara:strand:- start:2376 stop:3506 length:1131 start_codon:yes stop_codon:yes gene_type:complete
MPALRRIFVERFSLIDRYMLREFLISLTAVIGVLWLIYVATRFARYLAQAAVGNLPAEVIFNLLWLNSFGALSILLPIGTFLAVLLSLSRMSSDNELTVIAACGIDGNRILRNVVVFSGTMAIITGVLALLIVPDVLSGRYEIEQKAKIAANTTGLVAGSFKESQNGDWTFYSQQLSEDKTHMENIFIEIHRDEKPLIFRAERGRFDIESETGDKYLVLEDGYRYEGNAGDLDFRIAEYATHSMLIERGESVQVREKHKSLPTAVLWERGEPQDLAEIQWRVSSAVMTIILSVIAITLAHTGPRQGRYAGFFPAVLVYVIYSNLLGVTRAWVEKGDLAPWIGAIWVHLLMIGIMLMLQNRLKLKRFWQQRKRPKTA